MQTAMDKLARFLERRRLLVLGIWVALLLAAAPFAARQTEHLTSGGFERAGIAVPGRGSQPRALRGRPARVVGRRVAVREGGDRRRRARHANPAPHRCWSMRSIMWRCPRPSAARVLLRASRLGALDRRRPPREVVYNGDPADQAGRLPRAAIEAPGPRRRPYLVGQQALGGGMQDPTKGGPGICGVDRVPDRPAHPAGRLRLVAAAQHCLVLGLLQRGLTGAGILPPSQLTDMSVFGRMWRR